MKIWDWLASHEEGSVLADSDGRIVRLWVARPPYPQTLRALERFFPALEFRGSFLRLGGWRKLTEAIHSLAEAKMASGSPWIQNLHLVEGSDGEGMKTIPPHLLQ